MGIVYYNIIKRLYLEPGKYKRKEKITWEHGSLMFGFIMKKKNKKK